jgi:hypothetical protein
MDKALNHIEKSKSIQTVILSFFGSYALETSYSANHIAQGVGPKEIKILSKEFKSHSKSELLFLGLDRAISELEQAKKSVVIIIDVPELPFFPKACIGRPFSLKVNKCSIEKSEALERQMVLREIINQLRVRHTKLRIFDSLLVLCDSQFCYAKIENFMLYRDSHHLSFRGSAYFAKQFLNRFAFIGID